VREPADEGGLEGVGDDAGARHAPEQQGKDDDRNAHDDRSMPSLSRAAVAALACQKHALTDIAGRVGHALSESRTARA
jgi:hypothetical protein